MGIRRSYVALAFAIFLLSTTVAAAQGGTPNLSLRTAAGGGGAVSAGGYNLTSSIGQHDAGAQASGGYVVAGGVLVAKAVSGPSTPTPVVTPNPNDARIFLPVINK